MKNCLCLFVSVLFLTNSKAQETGEKKLGAWYMCYSTNKVSNTLSISSGAEIRAYETINNFNQFLLLTGLNYHIKPYLTATAGYIYLNTNTTFEELPNEINSNEHRIYEQINFNNKLWNFKLSHRYRLEQRIKNIDTKTNTQLRIRYRLQFSLPLSKVLFLRTYDEIFLNLQGNAFSQNRLFASIGVKIIKEGNIQIGYLKNNFSHKAFDRLQIGLLFTTDFRKNKI